MRLQSSKETVSGSGAVWRGQLRRQRLRLAGKLRDQARRAGLGALICLA